MVCTLTLSEREQNDDCSEGKKEAGEEKHREATKNIEEILVSLSLSLAEHRRRKSKSREAGAGPERGGARFNPTRRVGERRIQWTQPYGRGKGRTFRSLSEERSAPPWRSVCSR